MAWDETMFEMPPVKVVVEKAEVERRTSRAGNEYKQLHVMYRPIDGTEVHGQTGCFHGYYPIFRDPNGPFAHLVKSLSKVGAIPPYDDDDKNAEWLTGKVFKIKRIFIEEDEDTGAGRDVWVVTEFFGEDKGGAPAETTQAEAPKKSGNVEDTLEELLEEGVTMKKLKRVAKRNGWTDEEFDEWFKDMKDEIEDRDGVLYLKD